jgi:radical SAM superfamily enzyme YgiQ (UPF0313 family)
MNVLLVAPSFPITYWGFQYSLSYTGKQVTLPPLGLITVAALLPEDWHLRLVDTDIRALADDDLAWADAVLVGGMRIQAQSIHDILARARAAGVRTVVGGPAPTTSPAEYADADVVFCGEAEGRQDELVAAITGASSGAKLLPAHAERPDMELVPAPRYDLVDLDQYASVSIQYSRGCPYECEFCDIIQIFGRRPRVKSNEQVLAELGALYDAGYRGTIFFVDDNFIGNRPAVKRLLPEIAGFQKQRGFPYELYTEASVNLASDDALLAAMVEAGFNAVFLGIETPSPASLAGANKKQNLRLDLVAAVDKITRAGIEVMAGFIVGFDEDSADSFSAQSAFIAEAGIPLAMVGLLIALPGTALERRLVREGRLRKKTDGDQFGRPNFVPLMDEATLLTGYIDLLATIYSPDAYYERCISFVDRAPKVAVRRPASLRNLLVFAKAIVGIGILSRRRRLFWRLLGRAATRAPHNFGWAVGKAVMGEHLIRYTSEVVLPRLRLALADVEAETASAAKLAQTEESATAPEAAVAAS